MLHLLLLAVNALPACVPYGKGIVHIDYDSDKARLVVGSTEEYVQKVMDTTRWNGLTRVNIQLPGGRHTITKWRAGTHGLYLTTKSGGKSYKVYLLGITDIRAVTKEKLDPLIKMYTSISQKPGMRTKQLVDFVVPKQIQDLLTNPAPDPAQVIAALPQISPTTDALVKTDEILANYRLYPRQEEEKKALLERFEQEKNALREKRRNQKDQLQQKEKALTLRHQLEIEEFQRENAWRKEEQTLKILEEEKKRRQQEVHSDPDYPTPATRDPLLHHITYVWYPTEKAKLGSKPQSYQEDFDALSKREHAEMKALMEESNALDSQASEDFGYDQQQAELKHLEKRHHEERLHSNEQLKKIYTTLDQLDKKRLHVLTPAVAEQISNPTAAKTFIEVVSTTPRVSVDKLLSSLWNSKHLSRRRLQLVKLATIPTILKRIGAELFVDMAIILIKGFEDHPSRTTQKERTHFAAPAQDDNTLTSEAFTRVVTKMQGRFNFAEQEARQPTPNRSDLSWLTLQKEQLVKAAKDIWAPYGTNNSNHQAKIRTMSPEAARTLEAMANIPLPAAAY